MEIDRPEAEGTVGSQNTSSGAAVPLQERRKEPRTTMSRLIYLDMGAENGGVVTDMCSGGLCLRAAHPMDRTGAVSFSLMADGLKLGGSAEIVWTDEARKSCGLRFTSVSPSLELHIGRWMSESRKPNLPTDAVAASLHPISESAATVAKISPPETRSSDQPVMRGTFLMDDWAKQEDEVSHIRSRAFRWGVAMGFLLAVGVAGVPFYFGLATWGRAPLAARAAQAPQAPQIPHAPLASTAPAPLSSPASAPSAPSASDSTPAITSIPSPAPAVAAPVTPSHRAADSLPLRAESSAAVSSDQKNPQSHRTQERRSSPAITGARGKSALVKANAYLRTGRNREAALLLWSATSAGNTTAEVQLADLYLRGKGVTRSCTQGRVLLTSAAKKGSIDAQHRLVSLRRSGCR